MSKINMIKSIKNIWNKENNNQFIRFKNKNTLDCRVENLEWVSINDAMNNINDWKVDWDMELSKKQIEFVMKNPSYFKN